MYVADDATSYTRNILGVNGFKDPLTIGCIVSLKENQHARYLVRSIFCTFSERIPNLPRVLLVLQPMKQCRNVIDHLKLFGYRSFVCDRERSYAVCGPENIFRIMRSRHDCFNQQCITVENDEVKFVCKRKLIANRELEMIIVDENDVHYNAY